jgi:ketosteroid isomerase-like protein
VAVGRAVEALRRAILAADADKLRELVADELSYGLWPSGAIQNKAEFIVAIADKRMIYTSLAYSDPGIAMAGDDAIVRHRESAKAHSGEKRWSVAFDVLQVWQKQDGQWRLLARQGGNARSGGA